MGLVYRHTLKEPLSLGKTSGVDLRMLSGCRLYEGSLGLVLEECDPGGRNKPKTKVFDFLKKHLCCIAESRIMSQSFVHVYTHTHMHSDVRCSVGKKLSKEHKSPTGRGD